MNLDEAHQAYLSARARHAELYQASAEKWDLLPVRQAVGKAYDDMAHAQRVLQDLAGGQAYDMGRTYVLALDAVLKAEGELRKANAMFESVKKLLTEGSP